MFKVGFLQVINNARLLTFLECQVFEDPFQLARYIIEQLYDILWWFTIEWDNLGARATHGSFYSLFPLIEDHSGHTRLCHRM